MTRMTRADFTEGVSAAERSHRMNHIRGLAISIALFAPDARAVEVVQWDWQCDQECFWQHGLDSPTGWNDEIVVAGYRYNWPTELPVIAPPMPAVPEPAAWLMFVAGLAAIGLRRK